MDNNTTQISNIKKALQHNILAKFSYEDAKLAADAIGLHARIKSADMPAYMQEQALRCARSLVDSTPPGQRLDATHLALALKKEFDMMYGPAWHCIAGTSFGSFVTHSRGGFLYFSIDSLSILLFKTEVQLVTEAPGIENEEISSSDNHGQ